MRLLHFTRGNQEYIVITQNEDDPDDFRKPGYEFTTACEVEFSNFTQGSVGKLPTEYNLVRED